MDIKQLMKEVAFDPRISDLHLTVNSAPIVRVNGDLQPFIKHNEILSYQNIVEITKSLTNEEQYQIFEEKGECDFSYSMPAVSRFRINVYRQRGAISLALRVIPNKIPSVEELGLPQIIKDLAMKKNGLILCTGPTGSGKSTTLAAMLDMINRTRTCHIITLEDPIEYLHSHKKSLVHQREIGSDTKSFGSGLRAALRQDPDVLLVGEMRDLETISIAIEAAETGHLVFATLHTNDAPGTVDRIIDVFPPNQQQQIRTQLATVLQGVIAQQLLKKVDSSGRVVALEVMVANPAIRNLIRENKVHQIYSAMQTGAKFGMQTMDMCLIQLTRERIISFGDGRTKAFNRELFERLAQRFASDVYAGSY
ncbi:MAG: type IV pilus twitching motility protein PilT [Halanaerobiales bacterium]|nr:type IV pilus twitching motility protein PilT [Halanaerobiales bacterium]